MKQKNKISYASILLFAFLTLSIYTVAQQPWVTNLNTPGPPFYNHNLGTTNGFSVDFYTNNTPRGTILTNGNYGINTMTPQTKLTVRGQSPITTMGWNDAIMIENEGALIFSNDNVPGYNYFFMGQPSSNPPGDFYWGLTPTINGTATPQYVYKLYNWYHGPLNEPQGTHEFMTRVLADVEIGVNLLYPKRRVDILDASTPQLRLTHTINTNPALGIFTDFQTMSNGDLFINPRNNNNLRNTGLGVSSPTSRLDINGDLNIRTVNPQPTTLNQVLVRAPANFGKVYWRDASTLGSVTAADNGTSLSGGNKVVLGNDVGFNQSALSSDREIPMNGKNIIFSGLPDTYPGKVGFGIGAGNTGFFALRNTPITMQVNGSISIFDGNGLGNTSLLFGEEQFAPGSGVLGKWGIQYFGGGLNFWKPWYNGNPVAGNFYLFLADNGNTRIGGTPGTTTLPPVNTLEIYSNSTVLAPTTSLVPTRSGLRFHDLKANSVPLLDATSNSSGTVLSVNDEGDVILVKGSTGTGFDLCSGSSIPNLVGNSGLNLADNNLFFEDGGTPLQTGINDVVIGKNCNSPASAKLDVLQRGSSNNGTIGVMGVTEGIGNVYTAASALINNAIGVFGEANGNNNAAPHANFGGVFRASGVTDNFGVCGVAVNALNAGKNYGGSFVARNATVNYGVYAVAFNLDPLAQNYGVWAKAPTGSVQPYPAPPSGNNFAGFFDGDVARTGNDNFMSDINMKENIDSIPNALDKIMRLNPRKFNFKTTQYPQMSLPNGLQFGMIAQNVDTVIPEMVKTIIYPAVNDSLGNVIYPEVSFKTLSYSQFVPFLVKAIQEQQAQISNLQNQISQCCNNNQNAKTITGNSNNEITSQTDVSLSNRKIVLDQNAPNPFKEQTTITYEIKTDFTTALIIFIDNLGEVIKEVPITQKGKGQLNVYASDLTSGIYTYTIVVDGNTIDSKKMIKTK